MADDPIAKFVRKRYDALKTQRQPFEPIWTEIARYMMPSMGVLPWNGSVNSANIVQDNNAALFDGTAANAADTFASGQCAYLTPPGQAWFVFDPPQHLKDKDPVKQWYQQCSAIALLLMAKSNFYPEAQRYYLSDGVFGTSAMFCEPGESYPINFRSLTIGTYVISEDRERMVNVLHCEWCWTASECAEKFGEENLSDPMKKALAKEKDGSIEKKWKVIHAIYPRPKGQREEGKRDPSNKAYASVYLDYENNFVMENGGYDEKPFFSSRYEQYGESPYGSCPAWRALPEARQLNFLVEQLDALAEVKAWPRLILPEDFEGEVDMRAGGKTYASSADPNSGPREWMTQGDYNIGLDREKRKEEAINKAFHTDLFALFANLDAGKMTAYEASQRAAEKLNMFVPSFLRKTTELFNPLLARVFGICLRGGYFPQPPPEAVQIDQATGEPYISDPDIVYSSRVALAIQSQQNAAFSQLVEMIMPMAQVAPNIVLQVLDNFNIDEIYRDGARNEGIPAEWIKPTDQRDAERQAQQEAAQAQQQQQQMLDTAEAAKNAGSVKQDSVLGSALTK